MVTAGGICALAVAVLTRTSFPSATPELLNERAKMSLVPRPSARQAMTKLPDASTAIAGESWLPAVVLLATTSPVIASPAALNRRKITPLEVSIHAAAVLPGDDEVADGIHPHRGIDLRPRGRGINDSLAPLGHAQRVVSLGVNIGTDPGTVHPGHDEVAGGVHRHASFF